MHLVYCVIGVKGGLMHLAYCAIGVKGGLKGWTVLRCGAAVRSGAQKGRDKRKKGKRESYKQKTEA